MVKLNNGARGQAPVKTLYTMKKAALLLLCGGVVLCSCQKTIQNDTASKDAALTGQEVSVSQIKTSFRKIFVLNEGGMGSNNASLDFLRSDGTYVTGAFKKMNPDVATGLGDVANDIAIKGSEVWMTVNNSGIVEVVSAEDETEIAAIPVPTPRNICFDNDYAYVSSWAGAFARGRYDEEGNYIITDSSNPKGQVYRINLKTKKAEASVEVGYQPEGMALADGKLYVANSGGISSQLPPSYSYDNTVSVIDTKSFKVVSCIEAVVNLKYVYADKAGHVYVTTMGDYWSTHSGLYRLSERGAEKISDYVSVSCMAGNKIYFFGAENEFDWSAAKSYKGFCYNCTDGSTGEWNFASYATTPYSLLVFDEGTYMVGDAGDYFNPGSISLYAGGKKIWTTTSGVCPGHFAIW